MKFIVQFYFTGDGRERFVAEGGHSANINEALMMSEQDALISKRRLASRSGITLVTVLVAA